jgi:hypothetical protein
MVMRNENDGIVITPDYDEKRIQRNEINWGNEIHAKSIESSNNEKEIWDIYVDFKELCIWEDQEINVFSTIW